jgi:radical SAM superfamily enzyme YgiQ (UPF0313 family)
MSRGILVRPPCEACSVLIEVTEGCPWNLCTFCWLYKGDEAPSFRIRSWKEIFEDLTRTIESCSFATNFFLGGSNAICAEMSLLLDILRFINKHFPHPQHISSYARVADILKKTDNELKQLYETGLRTLYIGIETGSSRLLDKCKKGTTPSEIIRACKNAMQARFILSVNVILGLGGKKFSEEHIAETIRILNVINPHMIRFKTLHIMPNSPLFCEKQAGIFDELQPREILKEQRRMIKELTVSSKIFNDHNSNYQQFNLIGGKSPSDREGMKAARFL